MKQKEGEWWYNDGGAAGPGQLAWCSPSKYDCFIHLGKSSKVNPSVKVVILGCIWITPLSGDSELGPFLDLVVWRCRSNPNRYSGIRYSLAQLKPNSSKDHDVAVFLPKGFFVKQRPGDGKTACQAAGRGNTDENRLGAELQTINKISENERKWTSIEASRFLRS